MRLEPDRFPGADEIVNGGRTLDLTQIKSDMVRRAYTTAEDAHRPQKRESGQSYFDDHLRQVAGILYSLFEETDPELLAAALLHDTLEDTMFGPFEIESQFGPVVARLVEGVTNLEGADSSAGSKVDQNFADLRKVTRMAAEDWRIWLVKLADRTHNGSTLRYVSPDKASTKAEETLVTYCRILEGFGIFAWKRDLENIFFPYLHDFSLAESLRLRQKLTNYEIIKEWVDDDPRRDETAIRTILDNLKVAATYLRNDTNLRVTLPSYYEVYRKLKKMVFSGKTGSLQGLDKVNDLVHFEIVLPGGITMDDRLAVNNMAGVIKEKFRSVLIDQNDGLVRRPGNLQGYELIVAPMGLPVSILICTEEMMIRNDWGAIADKRLGTDWDHNNSPLVFFTPDRKMVVAHGNTALDAVVAIADGSLVDRISMILVNGSPVPLSGRVEQGDVVEVVLSPKPLRPTKGWLNIVDLHNRGLVERAVSLHGDHLMIERGKMMMRSILRIRGVLDLEDLLELKGDTLANELGSLVGVWVGPDSLYRGMGCEVVDMATVEKVFDKLSITKEGLGWSSFEINGSAETNVSGMLEKIATVVKDAHGNVILSYNKTHQADRSFYMKMVVEGVCKDNEEKVVSALIKLGLAVKVV